MPRIASAALALLLAIVSTAHAQSRAISLGVEGRANSNPTVATNGQYVAVVWSAATTNSMDIYAAMSRDGGATFAAPVQVNTVAGDARVSGEEPARVALVPRKNSPPEVVVVWTSKNGANWKLQSSRSTDGGRTFSAASVVPGSDAQGSRGWESVAVDSTGKVMVLWLDHRETVMTTAQHQNMAQHSPTTNGPAPKADPTEMAGLSQLYFSFLDGSDAVKITRSVCYCCKTTVASRGNNVYAVWRHVYPGSHRDIAFTVSRDRGKTFSAPVRVSDDHWQIDGCPDNGPSMAVDNANRVHVLWPTPADGTDMSSMGIFYAMSKDAATFSARTRVPTRGTAMHPQLVMTTNNSPIIAWDEVVEGTRRLGFARVITDSKGAITFTPIASPDASAGQWYPALASNGTGAVAVWVRQQEKGSVIGVARIP